MKTRTVFLLAVIALVLASCNVTDPYVKTKFNGIWVLSRCNDQQVATDSRNVIYLTEKEKAVLCNKNANNVWQEQDVKWTFTGVHLTVGDFISADLVVINDTMLLLTSNAGSLQYSRVEQKKSPFIGTWEVIDDLDKSKIGTVRLKFTEDGKYEYQTLTDNVWTVTGLKNGEWYIYKSFLALNTIESSGTTAELWDSSLATIGSDKVWLQNATDATGAIIRTRTLKFIQ